MSGEDIEYNSIFIMLFGFRIMQMKNLVFCGILGILRLKANIKERGDLHESGTADFRLS